MPDAPDRPALDPDAVAGHSFTRGRKGYDADEVRAYLLSIASDLREAQRERDDLHRRMAELERRATDPKDLDEASVTQLLGAEAARVLESARVAGADIRTNAEAAAATLEANALERAGSTREAADQYADSVRASADEYAASTRAAAETVLADRTTEAELAATSIRTDADAYDTRVREEADRYSTTIRETADAARASIDAEIEAVLADAREAGRAMVQEAREYRERVINDLADRRRGARAHIEHLASTRDELAVALTDVVTRVESARRLLDDANLEAGDLGDAAADRRALADDPPPATSVAVGELDEPEPVVVEPEPVVAVPEPEPEPEPEPVVVEPEPEPVAEAEPEDEVEDEDEVDAPTDEPPAVKNLFARIREEQEPEAVVSEDVEPEADAGDDAGEPDPDADLLDRRDATTDALERQLARRLKRVLSDEQNEVLDLLRRTRGHPGSAEVLPSEVDHLARHATAALEDLKAAERAGAAFFGEAPARAADVTDAADQFAAEMVRQIRARLERAFDDGGDENEMGERIRACYREWKTQRIADTARHYVVAAFSRGVVEAAPDGTSFRWVVDDGELPSPDCQDNALAGAVLKGEPFPTGDLCPPAHPGCRCLVVPVDA